MALVKTHQRLSGVRLAAKTLLRGRTYKFYGIENLDEDADDLIVVEGEADVIALGSLSIKAVSCPNGAPIKVSNNRVSQRRTTNLLMSGRSAEIEKRSE